MIQLWSVTIIDKKGLIPAKIYTCRQDEKTEEEALQTSKAAYEVKYHNTDYESMIYNHSIPII